MLNTFLPEITPLIIVLIFAAPLILALYRNRKKGPVLRDAPILLTQTARSEVINGHQGETPRGLPYSYLLSNDNLFSSEVSVGIFAVYLPFKAKAHLVGIPKGRSGIDVNISGPTMEPVVLEGNYSEYFDLFADTGQQQDSRYMLDPKAMVFTIDFCSNYYWEIANSTLYFFSKDLLPSFAIVDQFVEEIRPAIEIPSPTGPERLPYVASPTRSFLCPVCSAQLVDGESWMECPLQHGMLITGEQMREYREGHQTVVKTTDPYKDARETVLHCPYCTSEMVPTHFQGSQLVIDICSKCTYRWVDSLEAAGVLGIKKESIA
jgi:Zn-finger nucleic acid-binding protein